MSLQFQTPRGRGRCAKPSRPPPPRDTATKNRFSVLSDLIDLEPVEDVPTIASSQHESSTHVYGDSLVRNLGSDLNVGRNKKRQVNVYPGATINEITRVISRHDADGSQCLVASVGTNDAFNPRATPDSIIAKYRRLLSTMKDKAHNRFVVNIAPRMAASPEDLVKTAAINESLEKLCSEFQTGYIDIWSPFLNHPSLYKRDGIHFTRRGTSLLASKISSNICDRLDFLHLNLTA